MKRLILILGLVVLFSCEKEQCWMCSIYELKVVDVQPLPVYPFKQLEYVKTGEEIHCGTMPQHLPGDKIQFYCVEIQE